MLSTLRDLKYILKNCCPDFACVCVCVVNTYVKTLQIPTVTWKKHATQWKKRSEA